LTPIGRDQPCRGDVLLWSLRAALMTLIVDPSGHDFTLRQLSVLLLVCSEQGPHSLTELARRLQMSRAAIAVAMDLLEYAGLAKRLPSPSDRRIVIAVPTYDGRQVVENLAHAYEMCCSSVNPGDTNCHANVTALDESIQEEEHF